MSRPARIRAALIDLDGTLLDTAGDLVAAANDMLGELGLDGRPFSEVQGFIGQGIERLVRRCLPEDSRETDVPRALEVFERHYEARSGERTHIYAGVVDGLRELHAAGLQLACVTNKLERFTTPLLERTGLRHWFAAVVCGDSVARLKPDPAPYAEACRRLAVPPREAIVIGDSVNDVTSGRGAGCAVLCVSYGYSEGLPKEALGCDALVEDLVRAARYIASQNERAMERAR